MKQTAIIIVLLIVLGAVTFVFIHLLLSPTSQNGFDMPAQNDEATSTDDIATTTAVPSSAPATTSDTSSSIEDQGNPSDGPFAVLDTQGDDIGATVRILRSPEETLVQFADFSQKYPAGSHLYLSNDLKATKFVDLGPARLDYGVYLYDIPMDADQQDYPYVGIFSTSSDAFSYYANMQ